MFKEAMTHNEIVDLPIYALILFMAIFTIVTLAVWRRGKNNPEHVRMSMLPLEDDPIVVGVSHDSTTIGGTSNG